MVDLLRSGRTALALAVLVVVSTGCKPIDDAMVAVFGRSMREQPSIKPYEDPRSPAEGAIPFAAGNFAPAGQWNVGQAEAGTFPPPFNQQDVLFQRPVVMELRNPLAGDASTLARGEEMYLRACAPCHGPDGAGETGYIVQSGAYPLVFSLLTDPVRAYPDGYIYGIVRVGRGVMPAYGHQVTEQDRWKIVNYVRQLQGNPPAAAAAVPAAGEDEDR